MTTKKKKSHLKLEKEEWKKWYVRKLMKYNNDRTDIWWPAAGQYNNDLAGPISGCQNQCERVLCTNRAKRSRTLAATASSFDLSQNQNWYSS